MASPRDYYEVLGVPRDADAKVIKDAFRTLTLQYHPDRNHAPEAQEKYRAIVEAYAVLSDPEKRTAYDRHGFSGAPDMSGMSIDDLLSGLDLGDLLGGFGGDGGGLFDRFFRRGHARRPARGADIEVTLRIPLERVLTGGEEKVVIARPKTCDACHGSGARAGTSPKSCEACSGSGQHVVAQTEKNVVVRQISTCEKCAGRGTIIEDPCPACSARGTVDEREELTVKIPVGAEEGMVLRVPAHGLPSPAPGGAPGDLLIALGTMPDERFERRGADLHRVQTISVPDAVLGTTIEVPTLAGTVTAKVPRGTQPGQVLRIRHRGLPHFGGRGDLLVELSVHVPERTSDEEAALYAQLRALGRRSRARTASTSAT